MKTLYFFATGDCIGGTKITGPFNEIYKLYNGLDKIYSSVTRPTYNFITLELPDELDETKEMYAFVCGDPFSGMEIKTVNNDLTYLVETLSPAESLDSWFVVKINNPNINSET